MDYRYLLIIPGLFIIIALKAVYDSFSEKRKTKAMLLSRWGKLPDKEYAAGKYESIQKYYESIPIADCVLSRSIYISSISRSFHVISSTSFSSHIDS